MYRVILREMQLFRSHLCVLCMCVFMYTYTAFSHPEVETLL